MDLLMVWWMTNLTSGLSMPIPNATVATTTYKDNTMAAAQTALISFRDAKYQKNSNIYGDMEKY